MVYCFCQKQSVWSYTCCLVISPYKTNMTFPVSPLIFLSQVFYWCCYYYYFTIAVLSDSETSLSLLQFMIIQQSYKLVSIWKLFAVIWETHWWCQSCTLWKEIHNTRIVPAQPKVAKNWMCMKLEIFSQPLRSSPLTEALWQNGALLTLFLIYV